MSDAAIKLWHCHEARSLRPLWALEEMGLDYELVVLPFPPRVYQKDYLSLNVLGTVPYMVDGDTRMTESSAICQYLVDHYQRPELSVPVAHAEYGAYLNWLHHSDATLTFPQAIYLRYTELEPPERRQPQVAEDYANWFIARLRMLDRHLAPSDNVKRKYLCDDRFTIADIAVAYALYLGELQGLSQRYTPQVQGYLQHLKARPAFQRAIAKTA